MKELIHGMAMPGSKQNNMKIYLLIVLAISSCTSNDQPSSSKQDSLIRNKVFENTNAKCDTLQKITLLIQQAIDMPDIQQYYNFQNTKSQPDFVIEKNSFIKGEMILNKFGNKVKLLSMDEIKSKNYKAFISFKKISIKSDTANVFFEYPIEGLGCEAVFVYLPDTNNICYWKLLKSKIVEY